MYIINQYRPWNKAYLSVSSSPNISVSDISGAGFLLQVLQRVKRDWNYWQTSYSSKEGQEDARVIAGTCRSPSLKALLLTPRSGRTHAGFHSFRIIREAWRLESHVNVRVRNSVKKQNETRLLCAKGKSNRCKKCWVVLCAQGAPFYTNGFCILVLSRTKGPFSERSSSQIMTATPFYCSDLHRLKISSKQITFGKK